MKLGYIIVFIIHAIFLEQIGKYGFYSIPALVILGLIVFGSTFRKTINRS